jgi:Alternative oxidase
MTFEELRKGGYILDENGWLSVSIVIMFRAIEPRPSGSVSCSWNLLQVSLGWLPLRFGISPVYVSWYELSHPYFDNASLIVMQKRDSGWIHTLLEEAENERMHLM